MAAIRERQRKDGTKVFSVQVRMQGYPARSASFRTRRAAERWAKTIEAEMIEGKHFRSAEARRRTLGDAIDRYLEEQVPKKRDGSMHRGILPWWKNELGHLKLAEVSPALVAEARDKLAKGSYQRSKPDSKHSSVKGEAARQFPRSPSTVNKYLSCLSHVFTIARKEWHWAAHNPLESVSKLGQGSGRVRSLSDAERKALLAETVEDTTLHTFVLIALTTACRAGELQKLTWADVDLKAGRLLFRETKNAQPRTAWVQGKALELLKARAKVRKLKGGLVFESPQGGTYDYHKPFRAAVEAAGIANFRFHDLRHTAATYLAQQGATEQQLRAIGGWKSGVVARYVHLAAEDSKAALGKLAERIEE